ncbi:hypothetical protein C2845_PM05G11110 [Panicum miliaceum]|uniref:Uncharacterized protein n=1 Tax=Panicum miliaceum TaxID=4540 RepID=A0A3L6SX60_PANMI|nr:hypothetical protein C2845_PM05G11110 [Panicum miliaceum]
MDAFSNVFLRTVWYDVAFLPGASRGEPEVVETDILGLEPSYRLDIICGVWDDDDANASPRERTLFFAEYWEPSSSPRVQTEPSSCCPVYDYRGCAAAAAVQAVKKRRGSTTAPSECSQDAVVVSQAEAGGRSGGVPCYSVTITNTCLSCAVRDLHVSCGEFGSARLVDPSDFRRLAVGDCLVRGGGAVRPGETVYFEYTNQFQYDLRVASAFCTCG